MAGTDKIVPADLQSRFRLGYRPALDGLRGISILVVMCLHGGMFWLFQGGFLGVDIFFVLSGFLITSLLLEEWTQTGTINFRNFYIRRGLRLLPPLLLVIAICLLVVTFFPPAQGSAEAAKSILVALYLSDWMPARVFPPLFHTWSLSIEEQFYLVWPLLLFFLLRLRISSRFVVWGLFAGVLMLNVNRAVLWYHHTEANLVRVYVSLDTRSDTLLIGCIAGILVSGALIRPSKLTSTVLRIMTVASALAVTVLIFAISATFPPMYYGGFSAIGFMVATIIIGLFYAPLNFANTILEFPLLRWFGRLSYGLYLWHYPVYLFYDSLFGPFPIRSYTLRICSTFVVKFLLAVAVSSLSFYFVEQPALRLKKRFSAVRAGKYSESAVEHRMEPAREQAEVLPQT